MHYSEALLQDWNNVKDISAKDIALCIAEVPDTYIDKISLKMQGLNQKRTSSIGKEANKIAKNMLRRAEKVQLLIQTASAMGHYFEAFGGVLYGADGLHMHYKDDELISDGDMPKNIKTLDEAVAVFKAVTVASTMFAGFSNFGIRAKHSSDNAIKHNNVFLKFTTTREQYHETVKQHILEALTKDDSFKNTDRLDRIARTIIKHTKHFLQQ